MQTPSRFPGRFPAALGWLLAALAMLALGLYAEGPVAPLGAGPMRPRVPAPAADFPSLLYRLGIGSPLWFAIAGGTPLLALISRRIDPERVGWRAVALLGTGVVLLGAALSAGAHYLVVYGTAGGPPVSAFLQFEAPRHLIGWLAAAGVVTLLEARRRTIQAAFERERLRGALAEQRLLTLTAQLHPHFLFNTLQGISTLIHRDPAAADEMLALLSDLLREVLRHRDRALVPLAEEVRFARLYLEITRIRFPDRFRFEIDIPDELLDASVPLFLLQPLLENAVSHGIGDQLDGGCVAVRGEARGTRLILTVTDDGAGIDPAAIREGLGLRNTRDRLAAGFGPEGLLALEPGRPGTIARIEMPLRRDTAQ